MIFDERGRVKETHIVVAGHRKAGSCDPTDPRRQQWVPAWSESHGNGMAAAFRSGAMYFSA